jgi:hypothetical protein
MNKVNIVVDETQGAFCYDKTGRDDLFIVFFFNERLTPLH